MNASIFDKFLGKEKPEPKEEKKEATKEQERKEEKKEKEEKKKSALITTSKEDLSWVVINPRITEKSAFLTGDRGYTFNVSPRANKIQIKKAIKQIYGVDVVKVTTSTKSPRKTLKRGRKVHIKGAKKAVVFLKKGDKIEFV